jgi:hypothetical protein
MSREVPEHIGELSRYAMQEALDKVDRALADAPEDVRAALSVIRLVENMPRQVPWYGASVLLPDGDSVSVGTVLRNAFEAVGDSADDPPKGGDHWFTRRYRPAWQWSKREYNDFLLHLLDPERWERERLSAERAALIRRQAAGYLASPESSPASSRTAGHSQV